MMRCGANVWICARLIDDVSEHWRHCFSQHFSWFMHESWGGVAVITHLCLQAGHSNLTTSWSFTQPTRRTAPLLQPGRPCVYVALHYIIPLSPCRIALSGVFSICRPVHVADKLFRCALIERQNTTRLLSWGVGGRGVHPHTSCSRNVSVVRFTEKKNVKLCLALQPGLCSTRYRFSVKNITGLCNICFISE